MTSSNSSYYIVVVLVMKRPYAKPYGVPRCLPPAAVVRRPDT